MRFQTKGSEVDMLIYEYVKGLRDGIDRWDDLKSKINEREVGR